MHSKLSPLFRGSEVLFDIARNSDKGLASFMMFVLIYSDLAQVVGHLVAIPPGQCTVSRQHESLVSEDTFFIIPPRSLASHTCIGCYGFWRAFTPANESGLLGTMKANMVGTARGARTYKVFY